jgi:hypothetical protein
MALFLSASTAIATEAFPPATGPGLLTVTGTIDEMHGDAVVLDRALLDALPRRSFATSTIWSEGIVTFEGVPISALLERLGVESGTLHLTAVNDYSIDIPVEDLLSNDPILADRMNGQEMSLRDKGPLWLVYPYDEDDRFQTEVIFSRSIWQLDRIEVRD